MLSLLHKLFFYKNKIEITNKSVIKASSKQASALSKLYLTLMKRIFI